MYNLIAYQNVYGNLYDSLSQIFKSPYDSLAAVWFDGEQNTYSMVAVNNSLPTSLGDLLNDPILTAVQNNLNLHIWQDLRLNDVYNWTPQILLRLFYCHNDDQVPYQNSVVARDTMQANGAPDVEAIDVNYADNHTQCGNPALTATYNFFMGMAHFCTDTTNHIH